MVTRAPLTKDTAAMWSLLALALLVQFGVGQALGLATRQVNARLVWFVMALCALGLVATAYTIRFPVLSDVFGWRPTSAAWLGFAAGAGGLLAFVVRTNFGDLRPIAPETLIMATTCGPLLEELLFRGFLWGVFTDVLTDHVPKFTGTVLVAIAAALVFGLAHQNPTVMYFWLRFGAGVLHGVLRAMSKSSVPPAAAHWAFNVALVS